MDVFFFGKKVNYGERKANVSHQVLITTQPGEVSEGFFAHRHRPDGGFTRLLSRSRKAKVLLLETSQEAGRKR